MIHSGPNKLHASQDATFIISADGEDVGTYGFQYRINGGGWSRGDTSDHNVVGSGYEFTLRDVSAPRLSIRTRLPPSSAHHTTPRSVSQSSTPACFARQGHAAMRRPY